jgi:hypothetical protein
MRDGELFVHLGFFGVQRASLQARRDWAEIDGEASDLKQMRPTKPAQALAGRVQGSAPAQISFITWA